MHEMEKDIISVNMEGFIKTFGKEGQAIILIEEEIESKNQIIGVQITRIFSLVIKNSFKANLLPIGAESFLEIVFQDKFGRSFPQGMQGQQLVVFTSNPYKLETKITDSQALYLKGKAFGTVFCTVYLKDKPDIYDQIIVTVGSVISPQSPIAVHIGGVINFKVSEKLRNDAQKSKWFSEDSDIIWIESQSGKAKAMKTGTIYIQYKDVIEYKSYVTVY